SLTIEEAPEGTRCYAVLIEDKDAFPISGGFSWIHWVAANIEEKVIEEGASQQGRDFVQGVNSWISQQGGAHPEEECCFYGGMAPPDAPHIYEIHVFALDKLLDLKNGFHLNQLFRQMHGHILDQVTLRGQYAN
ncbi:MAG: YbhB/YbcL family Raf kinase inhibitor-like protein, partial [Eubacterium sp.]